jgi:diguanylate cyclase (GGDEF)-like protein
MKWLRPTITGKFMFLLFGFFALQFLQLGVGIYSMTSIEGHATLVNAVNEQRLRTLQLAEFARNVSSSSASAGAAMAQGQLVSGMEFYGKELLAVRSLLKRHYGGDPVLLVLADDVGEKWTTVLYPLLRQVLTAQSRAVMQAAIDRYQTLSTAQIDRLNDIIATLEQRDRKTARELGWTQTVIVGLSLLLVAFGIVFVRQQVTRPLRHFFEATRAMANGAYDRRVEVASSDEVGELARSFNRMAAAVDDKTARLHALNEVALIVTSSLSLSEILDQIMLYGMPLAGARGVCIAFYDEATRTFTNQVTRGLSDRYVDKMSFPPGGLADEAMRRGEPVLCGDRQNAPFRLWDEARKEGIRSVVCLPLASDTQRLGVILFYRDDRDEFSFEDIELIHTFSHLATHAIQNARLHARTVDMAETDALTGLYNRRKLEQRLREEIQRSQRSHLPLALVLLDIDHFKNVNDTHGHTTGDAVLKALASTFRREIRDVDLVARVGGEEFMFLLPDTDPELAQRVAERIRRALTVLTVDAPGEEKLHVSGSFGIACYPLHANNAESLIANADRALYAAKQAGRNRALMYAESMLH